MTIEKPKWWKTQHITNNNGYKYNGKLAVQGLVIHSTAWPGKDAQGIFEYFNSPNCTASIHGALDDAEFIQTMPFDKVAGHVGFGKNGSYNGTHLGIEICEPFGLTYNFNGSAIVLYKPPKGYFTAVRDKAIHLFAYLCELYELDPLRAIVSHYEAHAFGHGSNHADIRHWWEVWENYTMDDFRRDVKEYMEGNMFTYEQFKEYAQRYEKETQDKPVSGWAQLSWESAIAAGVVDGTMPKSAMTREQVVTVLDRLGHFPKAEK